MKSNEISIAENEIYNLIESAVLALYAETGEKKFSDFNVDTQNYLMRLQKNLATKYNLPPQVAEEINSSFIYPDPQESY